MSKEIEETFVDLGKGKFVLILDNVLSEEYCKDLIDYIEENAKFTIPTINTEIGKVVDLNYRNNLRWQWFNQERADEIFDKFKDRLPQIYKNRLLYGIYERLSVLKYLKNTLFEEHYDSGVKIPYLIKSYITCQIYLKDLSEENGGATIFLKDPYNGVNYDYKVQPKVGRILLFQHDLLHKGEILKESENNPDPVKYCIRTNILYEQTDKLLPINL